MPKIAYKTKRFSQERMSVIIVANSIIEEFATAGYDLTLRQLYYQFVARDLIANSNQEYKRLGSIINDARMAGLIDWDHIVDRTRNIRQNAHWDSPLEIVESCASQFRIDKWHRQPVRPEVWIEKDALVGVIERVCSELDVPYFSCRGYTSQSEMWACGQRLLGHAKNGQYPFILHLGDHDPSGIDMTRDVFDRLETFMGGTKVIRLALNFNQIETYDPPPNPAKITDSRAKGYIEKYGHESWELDALDPQVITDLIRESITEIRDEDLWQEAVEEENEAREQLQAIADQWEKVQEAL